MRSLGRRFRVEQRREEVGLFSPGEKVWISIRPEGVELVSDSGENTLSAELTLVQFMGLSFHCTAWVEEEVLIRALFVNRPDLTAELRTGEKVVFRLPADRIRLLPEVIGVLEWIRGRLGSERMVTWGLMLPVWRSLRLCALPSYRTLAESVWVEGVFSLKNYRAFFSPESLSNLEALWNSVYISLLSVLFSALIGVPLALIFHRYDFPGRRLFASAAILPMVLPSLVGVMSFMFLYGESGLVTRFLQDLFGLQEPPFRLRGVAGILLVHAYTMYVYFYMTVSSAIRGIHPTLEEAAANLGAGP